MQRFLEPELLDHLDPADPEAVASRRELRWINAIMGNHRWLRAQLRKNLRPGERLLEIGAGDGAFLLDCMERRLVSACDVTALDLAPASSAWPHGARWERRSIFDPSPLVADVVVANLFLHHFTDARLAEIGSRVRGARLLLLSEPARRPLHLAQGALLAAVAGFGRVTSHDMMASIHAGFAGSELAAALGVSGWHCDVSITFLGAYRVLARNPEKP